MTTRQTLIYYVANTMLTGEDYAWAFSATWAALPHHREDLDRLAEGRPGKLFRTAVEKCYRDLSKGL